MNSQAPQFTRIYGTSATEAMWTYFRRFETVDATRRHFGDWLTADNADAARDCIRQGREYFASARVSSLLTRPVLTYYGMVTLAKLLFLYSRDPALTMTDIEGFERKGHGLKHHDAAARGVSAPYRLEAGSVEITCDGGKSSPTPRGIFPHLAGAILGVPVRPWLGQRVLILDALRAIPQLDAVLCEAFGGSCGYSGVFVAARRHDDGSVELSAVDSERGTPIDAHVAPVDSSMGGFRPSTKPRSQAADSISLWLRDAPTAYSIATWEEFCKDTLAVGPSLHGLRLDSLLAAYVSMYALSIVARYKPHSWSRILEGRDSPLLPVIETLVMVCDRWWPNLILNRLTGQWLNFSTPNYW